MKLPKSIKRSLRYIKILVKSNGNVNKKDVMRNFPSYVINDIVEILYNIIADNIDFESKPIKCLKPSKKPLPKLTNTPKKPIPKLMNAPKNLAMSRQSSISIRYTQSIRTNYLQV